MIQRITEDYDVMGFTGNGASYSIQIEAGIQDADVLIAVTESDELNLLSCTIAKKVGDCATMEILTGRSTGRQLRKRQNSW